MNEQEILLAIIPAFGGIMWWMFRKLDAKADATAKELSDFKLHVAEKYVTQTNLETAMNGIKDVLGSMSDQIQALSRDFKDFTVRVYDKLDQKADKP